MSPTTTITSLAPELASLLGIPQAGPSATEDTWPTLDLPTWLSPASTGHRFSLGAIIGGVLGGLVVFVVVVVFLVCRSQKRKRRVRIEPFYAGQAPSVGCPMSASNEFTPVTRLTPPSSIPMAKHPRSTSLPLPSVTTPLAEPQSFSHQIESHALARERQGMQHVSCPLSPETTLAVRTLLALLSHQFRDTGQGSRSSIQAPAGESTTRPTSPPPPYHDMLG